MIKRAFPKFNKNEYGIVFAFNTENNEQCKRIENKFIKPFQKHIRKHSPDFKVALLHSFTANKFLRKYVTQQSRQKFLIENGYKFLFIGECVFGNSDEKFECRIKLEDAYFSQDPMLKTNCILLEHEFRKFLAPLENVEIKKTTATDDFDSVSTQWDLVFEYILSLNYVFAVKYESAIILLEDIYNKVKRLDSNAPIVKGLRSVIKNRLCYCYNMLVGIELKAYYADNENEHLEKVKNYLDKATVLEDDSYHYKIHQAIFCFLYGRNVLESKRYLEKCKDVKFDYVWKTNLAFLKLYNGISVASLFSVYKAYKKLFEADQLTMYHAEEVDMFINLVLEKESDKKQIYFSLCVMYHFIGDESSKEKYFNLFKEYFGEWLKKEKVKELFLKLNVNLGEGLTVEFVG